NYILYFYKQERPDLAKDVMYIFSIKQNVKQNERFYNDSKNWKSHDDYDTLVKAVSELENSMK
ncbi:hypothetical protein E0L12_28040, partial [Escherichia coli]